MLSFSSSNLSLLDGYRAILSHHLKIEIVLFFVSFGRTGNEREEERAREREKERGRGNNVRCGNQYLTKVDRL